MGVSVGSSIYNAAGIYESGQGGGNGATIGGRIYKTLTIGGITWLAENLDFKFSGCGIGGSALYNDPHASYYNDDEAVYGIDGDRKCGLLYNWHAVKLLNDNKTILTPGWHVPTKDEWDTLANEIGGSWIAGTKLKSLNGAANGIWPTGWNGTDVYGFGAFPSGAVDEDGFFGIDTRSFFWAITDSGDLSKATRLYMTDNSSDLHQDTREKYCCYSVRLVKD